MKHESCNNHVAFSGAMFTLAPTLLILLTLTAPTAAAQVRVWYQPTPYPSAITSGVHVWDGWLNNYYYGQAFIQDDKLQAGGWGDTYRAYVRFDTNGLPKNVTQAALWLLPFSKNDGSALTNTNIYLVTGDWNKGMTWNTQPPATYLGWANAPTPNQWWGLNITPWYNNWRTGTNYGLRIDPQANTNKFDLFRSSRYTGDGFRPLLQLDFTQPVPTPQFKMPLPGNVSWLVTTEIGGHDCTGDYDAAHDGTNYFAIDFSWRNKNAQGTQAYSQPTTGGMIPIMAAAAGKVVQADHSDLNGNFVVIDHDTDGNVGTGFSTRYLHMKYAPSVYVGQTVAQGDILGWMGSTGHSTGDHLHFGIRFNDDGSATRSELTYVVMDGWILKSFQTECASGDFMRFYRSTNRTY